MPQASARGIIARMTEKHQMNILVLARHDEAAARLAEMMRGLPAEIWIGQKAIPQNVQLDLVVSDEAGKVIDVFWQNGIGILHVGGEAVNMPKPAWIDLPGDAGPREMQIACRLLAEVVRLQRQERAAAELHKQMAEEAMTDPLTGLPNRRAWQRVLDERIEGLTAPPTTGNRCLGVGEKQIRCLSSRSALNPCPSPIVPRAARGRGEALLNNCLCLAILDLDFFKNINDTHGHAIGDEVLRAAGRTFRACLRPDDFVARLGGDEFGLLLWVPDENAAMATVERVRSSLPDQLAKSKLPAVTASAGYLVVMKDQSPDEKRDLPGEFGKIEPDLLYRTADAALRGAKQQGRNLTLGGML
jgi:diguanylate cyclase (GGDEF)-like protein